MIASEVTYGYILYSVQLLNFARPFKNVRIAHCDNPLVLKLLCRGAHHHRATVFAGKLCMIVQIRGSGKKMQVVWCGMDSEIMTSLNYYALVILHLLYRCLVAKIKLNAKK